MMAGELMCGAVVLFCMHSLWYVVFCVCLLSYTLVGFTVAFQLVFHVRAYVSTSGLCILCVVYNLAFLGKR